MNSLWFLLAIAALDLGYNEISNPTGHSHPSYSASSQTSLNNSKWMSKLNSSAPLRFLTLPGTKESLQFYTNPKWQLKPTQSLPLAVQLRAGIRAFSLTANLTENNMILRVLDGAGFRVHLHDVLEQMIGFLRENPSESLVVALRPLTGYYFNRKYDADAIHPATRTLLDQLVRQLGPESFYRGFPYKNPTVSEVRGKIVLIENFGPRFPQSGGLIYGSSKTPELLFYDRSDLKQLNTEWAIIRANFEEANQVVHNSEFRGLNTIRLTQPLWNFLQRFDPFTVASGFTSPADNATRFLLGRESHRSYRDYIPVSCDDLFCDYLLKGHNVLAYEFLKSRSDLNVPALVFTYFPGDGLIDLLISINFRPKVMPREEKSDDYAEDDD